MKTGTCPKCGSTDVRFKKSYGQRGSLVLGLLNFTRLVDYLCPDCGYTEQYLENPDHIDAMDRKKWPRVRDANQPPS